VVPVFEEATGVRLKRHHRSNAGLRERFSELELRDVEHYDSPKHANDRFGGHFKVSIYVDDGAPDDGVVGNKGLSRYVPERGPEWLVCASASRANVRAEFWSDSEQITPKAEETWATLRSCLQRL